MELCWGGGGIKRLSLKRLVDHQPSYILQIMPWDSDIDVQVELRTMHFLARYYNMTMHHYATPLMPTGGRNYMLEVNPGYTNGSTEDHLNTIDARFIDTETGVFIDITTVRPKEGEKEILQVKDKHTYKVSRRRTIIHKIRD